jgi:hypothetical protein
MTKAKKKNCVVSHFRACFLEGLWVILFSHS